MWLPIKDFDGYLVSDTGEIKNKKDCIVKSRLQNSGYYVVNLYKDGKHNTRLVHRLVAEAFLEQDECKNEVDHKDRNKLNNSFDNLRWCNRSENVTNVKREKYKNNTTGEKCIYYVKKVNRWVSVIQKNKIKNYSPYFKTKEEAIQWRDDFLAS